MCLHIQMTGTDCWHQGYTMQRLRHPEPWRARGGGGVGWGNGNLIVEFKCFFALDFALCPLQTWTVVCAGQKKENYFCGMWGKISAHKMPYTNNSEYTFEKEGKLRTIKWSIQMHKLTILLLNTLPGLSAQPFTQQIHLARHEELALKLYMMAAVLIALLRIVCGNYGCNYKEIPRGNSIKSQFRGLTRFFWEIPDFSKLAFIS